MSEIFLSPWGRFSDPAFGDAAAPELSLDYPVSYRQLDESSYSAARVPILVSDPPAALLTDWRYLRVSIYPIVFEEYRRSLLASLDAWRDSWTVSAGGYTLGADRESQGNFTSLVTLQQVALSAGVIDTSSSVWIVDADGVRHTMTVAALLALLLSYGQAVQSLQGAYYTAVAAAKAAQAIADLDAITLPPGTA